MDEAVKKVFESFEKVEEAYGRFRDVWEDAFNLLRHLDDEVVRWIMDSIYERPIIHDDKIRVEHCTYLGDKAIEISTGSASYVLTCKGEVVKGITDPQGRLELKKIEGLPREVREALARAREALASEAERLDAIRAGVEELTKKLEEVLTALKGVKATINLIS
jgi:hypothetical protein